MSDVKKSETQEAPKKKPYNLERKEREKGCLQISD